MTDPTGGPPAPGNSDQIAFWSGAQGNKWARLQKRIDAMLAPLGREAMRAAAVRRGETVLDLGCGCGDTSFALADAVGPEGSVTGIDVSRPMLQRAAARASAIPELNLRFVEADAQTHPFPDDAFDLVYSRFGAMFFDDPVAGFGNLHRATRPGGRLALVAWRDRRDNPWATLPARVARAHVELPPTPPPNAPGQFAFADDAYVTSLLAAAGWDEAACRPYETRIAVGRDATDAADFLMEMGPAGPTTAEAGGAARQAVRADLIAALEALAGPNNLSMDFAVWIVTATKS